VKKLLYLFIPLIFFGCDSEDDISTSDDQQEINEEEEITGDVGYLYHEDKLQKTIDSGLNWSEIPKIESEILIDFDFISNSLGYIVTQEGNFYQTTNSGTTWELQSSKLSGTKKIDFINESVGYRKVIIGTGSYLYKTTNSGVNWTLQYAVASESTYLSNMSEFDFVSDSVGYRMTWDMMLFKTIDSGNTWIEIGEIPCFGGALGNIWQPSCCFEGTKIKFVNENVGYAASCPNGGGIYKTTDTGVSWVVVSGFDIDQIFISLDLLNESNGYVFMIQFPGSIGTLRRTTNFGQSWTIQNSDFSSTVFDSFRMDFISQ